MTAIDLVKRYFPSADGETAQSILWSCTAFPFSTWEHTEEQLKHMAVKAASPEHAIHLAHVDLDMAMDEFYRVNGREAVAA